MCGTFIRNIKRILLTSLFFSSLVMVGRIIHLQLRRSLSDLTRNAKNKYKKLLSVPKLNVLFCSQIKPLKKLSFNFNIPIVCSTFKHFLTLPLHHHSIDAYSSIEHKYVLCSILIVAKSVKPLVTLIS